MCTNESHFLYGHFMAEVSSLIFELDVDVKPLFKAMMCDLKIAKIFNPLKQLERRLTRTSLQSIIAARLGGIVIQ
jgi:hypothetical protein